MNLKTSPEQIIIISHDLSPSDTASMYNKNIIAFATDIGGRTSHSAIMAKTIGIPAVVGLKDATLKNQQSRLFNCRWAQRLGHCPADGRNAEENIMRSQDRINCVFATSITKIKDLAGPNSRWAGKSVF